MGNMARVRVTLRGTRPLLHHQFGEGAIPLEKQEKTGVAGNDPDEWKKTCMVTEDGELYVLDSYVFGCLRDAAKHTKKGKGTWQSFVAATLQVEEAIIFLGRRLPDQLTRDPTQPVYLDVRGVRNPSTKARNVRYRLACCRGWECAFALSWDKTVVPREVMRAIANDAGTLVGLADGRSIGFGRFQVTAWEVIGDAEETPAEGTVGPETGEGVAKGRRKVRPVQAAAEADGVPH